MNRPFVLHQITAIEIPPARLPEIAVSSGCDQISLFTYSPTAGLPKENSGYHFPLVTQTTKAAVLTALQEQGIAVNGVEFFPISAEIDVPTFAASLALGRELGAKRAVTLIFDDNASRAVDKLGKFCELARKEDLSVGLEFTPLTRGCGSLQRAVWFVDQLGNDSLGIGIDTLHLIRSGGTAEQLLALDPCYFRYVQMCDGHSLQESSDYFAEAHNREFPGKGKFPLRDILNALPASIPIEVEVPSDSKREAGIPAEQRAKDAAMYARAIIDTLTPSR